MFMRFLIIAICFFCVHAGSVRAETSPNSVYFQYDLDRIATYMNSLRNVSVGFVQMGGGGDIQRVHGAAQYGGGACADAGHG